MKALTERFDKEASETAFGITLQIWVGLLSDIACVQLLQMLRNRVLDWRLSEESAKECSPNRPNVLVIGPRCTGKTSLVQTVLSSLRDQLDGSMQPSREQIGNGTLSQILRPRY